MKYDTASWLSLFYPFLMILWDSNKGNSTRAVGFSRTDPWTDPCSTFRSTKTEVAVKIHITSILDYVNTKNSTIPMGRNGRGIGGWFAALLCSALFPASSKQDCTIWQTSQLIFSFPDKKQVRIVKGEKDLDYFQLMYILSMLGRRVL